MYFTSVTNVLFNVYAERSNLHLMDQSSVLWTERVIIIKILNNTLIHAFSLAKNTSNELYIHSKFTTFHGS